MLTSTLALHDALPIWRAAGRECATDANATGSARDRRWQDRSAGDRGDRRSFPRGQANRNTAGGAVARVAVADRKSTRLNSSHLVISYAVFCLKKRTCT